MDRKLKFRLQRSADDTLECFDSWILITMLASGDMATFVRQEAYERASLPEPQAMASNLYYAEDINRIHSGSFNNTEKEIL